MTTVEKPLHRVAFDLDSSSGVSHHAPSFILTAYYAQWKHLVQALHRYWRLESFLVPSMAYTAMHPMLHALNVRENRLQQKDEVSFRANYRKDNVDNPFELRSLGISLYEREWEALRAILPHAINAYPWKEAIQFLDDPIQETVHETRWFTLDLRQHIASSEVSALYWLGQKRRGKQNGKVSRDHQERSE